MDTFDIVAKLWPIVLAICSLCAWVGGLHVMVTSHNRSIERLFNKMDENQDKITSRIDKLLEAKLG